MQNPLSLVSKLSGAVVVGLLAYRAVQLYFKNDITIYITEVVHLPTRTAQYRRQSSSRSCTSPILTIEGKVEMETCVMNSYRFLLKLAGDVQSSVFDANKLDPKSSRGSRHRVLSLQPTNDAVQSSSFESFGDIYSLTTFPNGNGSRRHGPSLVITSVDSIVDAYEADATGTLAFTPACVSDGVLCRFTCVTNTDAPNDDGSAPRHSNRNSVPEIPASSIVNSPLSVGDTALRSIFVRSCFLESDSKAAYCQRLTMEIEFLRPVFGARVLIRLPNRHCSLLRSRIDGVGSVTQLPNRTRECVWDIGTVSEAMCAVYEGDTAPRVAVGETVENTSMPGAIAPVAPSPSVKKSLAKLELVFKQASPALFFGEDYDEAESTNSEDDDSDRYSGAGNAGSNLSHKRLRQSATGRGLAATDSSRRARKRKERARKANEKAARIEEARSSSSSFREVGGEDVPTVELVFSVNQLLSGTSVKKLQVLEERPNWTPRSLIDYHLFRRIMPGLEKLKLRKYAHYTTWFVQPVAVSRL
ncbi:hypothetical protein JKF63_06573 [Porcisia hertigi]|uniref:Uncharacterized protein n=1 Tax=Porcisia hertigi TaxID=2761500 RepID=A0A836IDW5_9TRYP|nr:hypothetical protein JKF63_06573 [Porcisia hertigi]